MGRMFLIPIVVLLAGCASVARPTRTAQETLDLFVKQLRQHAGEGAVDCGLFTVDGSHANDKWSCAAEAHAQRRPFFMGTKLEVEQSCASWSGYARNSRGETFDIHVDCSSEPVIYPCDLPFMEDGLQECSVLDSV